MTLDRYPGRLPYRTHPMDSRKCRTELTPLSALSRLIRSVVVVYRLYAFVSQICQL